MKTETKVLLAVAAVAVVVVMVNRKEEKPPKFTILPAYAAGLIIAQWL